MSNGKIEIPAKIKLGETEFVISETPELQALVQAATANAAATEKAKLYSKIKEIEQEVEQLNKVKIEAPISSNNNQSIDVSALKTEIITELTSVIQNTVNPLVARNKEVEQMELADYRNLLIEKNQGSCYPELIVGNTKDELDAALLKSKDLCSRYGNKLMQVNPLTTTPAQTTETKPADIIVNPPAPAAPATPATPAAQANAPAPTTAAPVAPAAIASPPNVAVSASSQTTPDIKNMDISEFGKRRDELLNTVKSLVNQ
jgi:hypothetical protein